MFPFDLEMYSRQKASELAARVRSIIGSADRLTTLRVARDLGVAEGDLREIVVYETPYPSVAVLAAVVAEYGVDAGWLLTGDYSPARHRADEELEAPAETRVAHLLERLDLPGQGS